MARIPNEQLESCRCRGPDADGGLIQLELHSQRKLRRKFAVKHALHLDACKLDRFVGAIALNDREAATEILINTSGKLIGNVELGIACQIWQ